MRDTVWRLGSLVVRHPRLRQRVSMFEVAFAGTIRATAPAGVSQDCPKLGGSVTVSAPISGVLSPAPAPAGRSTFSACSPRVHTSE